MSYTGIYSAFKITRLPKVIKMYLPLTDLGTKIPVILNYGYPIAVLDQINIDNIFPSFPLDDFGYQIQVVAKGPFYPIDDEINYTINVYADSSGVNYCTLKTQKLLLARVTDITSLFVLDNKTDRIRIDTITNGALVKVNGLIVNEGDEFNRVDFKNVVYWAISQYLYVNADGDPINEFHTLIDFSLGRTDSVTRVVTWQGLDGAGGSDCRITLKYTYLAAIYSKVTRITIRNNAYSLRFALRHIPPLRSSVTLTTASGLWSVGDKIIGWITGAEGIITKIVNPGASQQLYFYYVNDIIFDGSERIDDDEQSGTCVSSGTIVFEPSTIRISLDIPGDLVNTGTLKIFDTATELYVEQPALMGLNFYDFDVQPDGQVDPIILYGTPKLNEAGAPFAFDVPASLISVNDRTTNDIIDEERDNVLLRAHSVHVLPEYFDLIETIKMSSEGLFTNEESGYAQEIPASTTLDISVVIETFWNLGTLPIVYSLKKISPALGGSEVITQDADDLTKFNIVEIEPSVTPGTTHIYEAKTVDFKLVHSTFQFSIIVSNPSTPAPGKPIVTAPTQTEFIELVYFSLVVTATNPPIISYRAVNLPTTVTLINDTLSGYFTFGDDRTIELYATNSAGESIASEDWVITVINELLPTGKPPSMSSATEVSGGIIGEFYTYNITWTNDADYDLPDDVLVRNLPEGWTHNESAGTIKGKILNEFTSFGITGINEYGQDRKLVLITATPWV